jgi:hypothetical protein
MSIENEPGILIKNEKMDLSVSEIEHIKDFVKQCQKELIDIANGKIDHLEFSDKINNKGFLLMRNLCSLREKPLSKFLFLNENHLNAEDFFIRDEQNASSCMWVPSAALCEISELIEKKYEGCLVPQTLEFQVFYFHHIIV